MEMISLLADTGVQFFDVPLDLGEESEALKVRADFAELSRVDPDGYEKRILSFPVLDEFGAGYIDPRTKSAVDPAGVFTIPARQALECFENQWVPLPYFRKVSDREFQDGPTAWARMWLTGVPARTGGGKTHHLVLAFDTRCLEKSGDTYLTPTVGDALNIAPFGVAVSPEQNRAFLNREWVREWLSRSFDQRKTRLGLERSEQHFLFLGLFLTLLKVIEAAEGFPLVSLRKSDQTIDVDLILDVGNSRSCGLLLENPEAGQPVRFNQISRLSIRDLTRPDQVYDEPFEMVLEFAKAEFGVESAAKLSGLIDAFYWPSLVRVGHEAARLSIITDNLDDVTGMSSPKRYLWDQDRRNLPWRFNTAGTGERVAAPALNQFSQRFTEDGVFIRPDNDLDFPGMIPLYSRSSLMVFALVEILLHALCQINSVAHRRHRGLGSLVRRLKRIVLTCPTAMTELEKYQLRTHALEAVEALKAELGSHIVSSDLEVLPLPEDSFSHTPNKKEWGFDEATCVQLTFLYGEIRHRFQNDSELYFQTYGRSRKDAEDPDQPSLVLASVDIGGGTTDLMVCAYQRDPKAHSTVLIPEPKFYEGFNLAGDDILKRLIETLVLPVIRVKAEELGCRDAANVMNRLFSQDLASMTARDRARRRQFARQAALPIALGMLQHVVDDNPPESRPFDSFFLGVPRPPDALLQHVNLAFRESGAENFNLDEIDWPLETENINRVIRSVVQPMLGNLCGVISQFGCDFLLMAGRPTALPVIRDIILEYLPLPPDRVVLLGRYRIGTWYPFAEANGMITDAKTCVSVGGAVALMGGTLMLLDGFSLKTKHLKEKIGSTANYIGGYLENQGALRKPLLFSDPETTTGDFQFDAPLFIGRRQMDSDLWMATPMYRVRYADKEAARDLAPRLPLTVTINRPGPGRERIASTPIRILDAEERPVANDRIAVKLQTMVDEEGHWLDTGSFLVSKF